MKNIIVFHKTVLGYSHVVSGKPCQDYSLVHENGDNYIAIVCDGHGSDTYVRSDKGSELAANIAFEKIQDFIKNNSPDLFLYKSNAMTSKPNNNPLFDKNGNRLKFDSLTESEQEIVRQNINFADALEKDSGQHEAFIKLFTGILNEWKDRINQDYRDNPFNENENALLGSHSIEKAYGTTLMAFARTSLYWFAFQIGDGKLFACDRNLNWDEPVPLDYKCFLNITTSLCDENPIPEFRYAFNGNGIFPVAVFLGSDGVDGTLFTKDSLTNFYSVVILNLQQLGEDKTINELDDYLKVLSKKGSHDDMSIASIVDLSAISNGIKLFEINRKGKELLAEKEKKQKQIEDAKNKKHLLDALNSQFVELKSKIDGVEQELKKIGDIKLLEDNFKEWQSSTTPEINNLRTQRKDLERDNTNLSNSDEEAWKEKVDQYNKAKNKDSKEIPVKEGLNPKATPSAEITLRESTEDEKKREQEINEQSEVQARKIAESVRTSDDTDNQSNSKGKTI